MGSAFNRITHPRRRVFRYPALTLHSRVFAGAAKTYVIKLLRYIIANETLRVITRARPLGNCEILRSFPRFFMWPITRALRPQGNKFPQSAIKRGESHGRETVTSKERERERESNCRNRTRESTCCRYRVDAIFVSVAET